MQIHTFLFNPFQENTYLISDENGKTAIVDPGCYDKNEERQLEEYIEQKGLDPVLLLNTHTHLDHIFGNRFIENRYGLSPKYHKLDQMVFDLADRTAEVYGLNLQKGSPAKEYLKEGEKIKVGELILDVLLIPGHSPGHIVFYAKEHKVILGGDVLFKGSIGRTDLPGGNHNDLIQSIKSKIFTLEEEIIIYPGHGEPTTVGEEKQNNPFFK